MADFEASEEYFTPEEQKLFLGQNIGEGFKYSALSHSDSIRVFVLEPSLDATAPIYGEIVEHRLHSDSAKQGYTALSYVWGDETDTHKIHIGVFQLRIGHNLNLALLNLRRQDYPIRLWVDALCINQNDVSERNHQVQQMRTIYSSAFETVIYLGGETGGNTQLSAWNFLERHAGWAMNSNRDTDSGRPAEMESLTSFRGDLSDVEIDVLTRPWFKRLWVFQEVVVSKTLSIQCGSRGISWDDFCKILLLTPRHADIYGFSLESMEKLEIVRDMFQARCSYHELYGMDQSLPAWRFQVPTYKHKTPDILNCSKGLGFNSKLRTREIKYLAYLVSRAELM
ncbi:hypothetical protein E0Z10_g4908 [Xylaria hypoxylon]|uniref:Heterokaryon incompatibility domain-containing protein n=1 Tax=Xylaria hypoxylon TaxID=37992 RepID=A0A4Z0Z5L5_9PEZI|nr:hypothetical protein E0Z10_g4908 [Xylaria hypoxylon]